MTELNAKMFGETPNEMYLRTGQWLMFISSVSYFGISGFGVSVSSAVSEAPVFGFFAGFFMMAIGTYLRMVYLQKTQEHEKHVERIQAADEIKKLVCESCYIEVDKWSNGNQ